MSGRSKRGIEYSGWDVDIFENDTKIDELLEAQGWNGFSIYFYLCQRAYASDGYFYKWSYANAATTARRMGGGIGSETVKQTVAVCLQIGLFDKRLFDLGGVLTSKGIQRGYARAITRRKDKTVEKTLWLLDEDESKGFGIVPENIFTCDANGVLCNANDDYCNANSGLRDADAPNSRVEESRVEDSKVEQSRVEDSKPKVKLKDSGGKTPKSPSAPAVRGEAAARMVEAKCFSPELASAVMDWVQYKTEKRQPYKETGFKSLLSQIEKNARKYGDTAVVDLIEKCMSSNWQGIIWDRIRTAAAEAGYGAVPGWLEDWVQEENQ